LKKIKWFVTAIITLSMGIGIIDYPPAPPVQADVNKSKVVDLGIFGQSGQKKKVVEVTQFELELQKKLEEQKEAKRLAKVAENTKKMDAALAEVVKHAGKTRYVFSGSSPKGWDCSGLVRWFYLEHFEIELKHSATAQAFVGTEVKMPKPGDIVVYGYSKKDFFHASIYVGDNKVIHSGFDRGDSTEVISLSHPVFDAYEVKFVRVVETN
jgi:cell wall-associated NlpC family hydrolase